MVMDTSPIHTQDDVAPVEMSSSNASTVQASYGEVLIEETPCFSPPTDDECKLEEKNNQVRY